jgi:hypothetical protein
MNEILLINTFHRPMARYKTSGSYQALDTAFLYQKHTVQQSRKIPGNKT